MRPARLRGTGDPLIVVVVPERDDWSGELISLLGEDEEVRQVRLWSLARRAGTVWARGRADRRIAARFALRRALGRAAAVRLPGRVDAVYAPTLAARRVFAAAVRGAPGATRHLVEDVADLRQLHADLDRAADAHPDAVFLRRHRATPQQLATQEAERVLADVVHVRSRFAWDQRRRAGFAPEAIRAIGQAPPVAPRRLSRCPERPTLLLAGLATARMGTYEALAALDELPSATLLVRVGEGLEPAALVDHPRVRALDTSAAANLDVVDALIAPAWCESHLPELAAAAASGVPIVATTRAAGFVDLATAGAAVEPGDSAGLARAIRSVVTGEATG